MAWTMSLKSQCVVYLQIHTAAGAADVAWLQFCFFSSVLSRIFNILSSIHYQHSVQRYLIYRVISSWLETVASISSKVLYLGKSLLVRQNNDLNREVSTDRHWDLGSQLWLQQGTPSHPSLAPTAESGRSLPARTSHQSVSEPATWPWSVLGWTGPASGICPWNPPPSSHYHPRCQCLRDTNIYRREKRGWRAGQVIDINIYINVR